ncbi:MAG: PilW family protein [Sulfuricaulis sp.]
MRPQGYSLVELMVALTIGLIILGAVTSLFVSSKASYNTQQGLDILQENGRYAIRAMSDDVRLAGYVGLTYDPIKVSPQIYSATFNPSTSACTANWVNMGQPIFGINADSPTDNPNPYTTTCIPAADYKAGTDILVLRHASNQAMAAPAANTIYMLTELDRASFFTGATAPGPASNPSAIHEMNIHVYYIRPWATTAGDGIPTLVRETLIAGPAMVAQPLVEGIENMQVSYGIDTTVPGDMVVDSYVTADGVSDWAQVVSVRIELLVRAPSTEGGFANASSYTLGDITIPAANDKFRRGVYSTTIMLRNHRKT